MDDNILTLDNEYQEDVDLEGELYAVGERGYSAYEIAVQNGFIGTEEEWLESLVGPQGDPGYSPSASVTKSGDTATITITDEQGTTTATVSDGQDGEGVPTGGTAGQILSKVDSTDYNTEWVNAPDISNMVTTDTVQDISGKKTFTTNLPESSIVPSNNNQLINKKYVDDSIKASTICLGNISKYNSVLRALNLDTLEEGKIYLLINDIGNSDYFYVRVTSETYGLIYAYMQISYNKVQMPYLCLQRKNFLDDLERLCYGTLYGHVVNLTNSQIYNYDYMIRENQEGTLSFASIGGYISAVNTNGTQTISGTKTFTTLPESSVVPTTDNQLVNKKYVDDNGGQAIQYDTVPTASEDTVGEIIQYIGTTDANYTHGYFYECVSDGEDPATYSWSALSVQEGLQTQYSTMPTPSAELVGKVVQYIGATDSNYTNGYFYVCVNNGGFYIWQQVDVQPGGEIDPELEEKVERNSLYENALITEESSGTELILDNTAECPINIILGPNMTQHTTTGKNLFDGELEVGDLDSTAGAPIVASGNIRSKNFIPVSYSYSSAYKLSKNGSAQTMYVYRYDSNKTFISRQLRQSFQNFTITNTTAYIKITYVDAMEDVNAKVQIEKGSTITSFEEYTGGIPSPNSEFPQTVHTVTGDNTIILSEGNKNLIHIKNITAPTGITVTEVNDTEIILNGTASANGEVILDLLNITMVGTKTYASSVNMSGSYSAPNDEIWLDIENSSGLNLVMDSVSRFTITAQEQSDVNVGQLSVGFNSNTTFTNLHLQLQLEQNSYATEYVSHQEQILPVTLGTLEYCKIGDYEDEFYLATESDTSLVAGKWYLKKNIGKTTDDIGSTDKTISDMVSDATVYSYCGGTVSGQTITYSSALIVENEIYYPTTTPEYILLNDTLQIQLTNITKALSYQEQTNIIQVNDDLPFIINASVIQNTEDYIINYVDSKAYTAGEGITIEDSKIASTMPIYFTDKGGSTSNPLTIDGQKLGIYLFKYNVPWINVYSGGPVNSILLGSGMIVLTNTTINRSSSAWQTVGYYWGDSVTNNGTHVLCVKEIQVKGNNGSVQFIGDTNGAELVDTTNSCIIGGIKTFSQRPICSYSSVADNLNHLTTKKYVDQQILKTAGLTEFSDMDTYAVGDYVYKFDDSAYKYKIYRCIVPTQYLEPFDITDWTELTYLEYLSEVLVGNALGGSY